MTGKHTVAPLAAGCRGGREGLISSKVLTNERSVSAVAGKLIGIVVAMACLTGTFSIRAVAAPFEYPDVLRSYLYYSSDFDYEAAADDYLRCERPAVWRTVSNDEFKLAAAHTEAVRLMHAAAARGEADGTFTLLTSAHFGEYDPKAQRFSFRPFSVASFFSVVAPTQCGDGSLPRQIDLYFANPELVDGLPMLPDAAKDFLERRKSDRSVQVTLTVKVTGTRGDGQLDGQIVKAEVVDQLQQAAGVLAAFGK